MQSLAWLYLSYYSSHDFWREIPWNCVIFMSFHLDKNSVRSTFYKWQFDFTKYFPQKPTKVNLKFVISMAKVPESPFLGPITLAERSPTSKTSVTISREFHTLLQTSIKFWYKMKLADTELWKHRFAEKINNERVPSFQVNLNKLKRLLFNLYISLLIWYFTLSKCNVNYSYT